MVYTDPPWAIDESGRLDTSLASIESEIYGAEMELGLGVWENGDFIRAGERLHRYVRGADALVVYRCQVTEEMLQAAGKRCRVVARQGVGIDNVDVRLLREAGVFAFHVPDYCGDEVSTHAVALLLALERGICSQNAYVKGGRWSIYAGGVPRRTAGLTAGMVGYGRIARSTSRKLENLYGTLLAYDPYVPEDVMASHGVRRCERLADLLKYADAILLHAALTSETAEIINSDSLRHGKRGALLVNTARGALVNATAVDEALADGRLGGFASDVFTPEDPNRCECARRLLARDNVIVTAHRAFLSDASERSLRRRVAEGVAHVLMHDEPPPMGRLA